ncbi:acid phosphatase precursor [Aaosphaeria arxii CBS 175.79]|uniref:Acid phosphatase n=1 Tax=Aaosphaeria arxii CBS 175.79 TaxID=1450172 RepID=A0A6A5Y7R9_9PLEO|nr:acid phosphatase precursor [Aaosphaeria arxii CBS 175.79]KAF2020850.1 acid phosphatase precursor [Aaosphaeria arxii CBS 175.79]
MHFSLLCVIPLVHAARIIQSNDDGWAEANVRTFFNTLTFAGHDVVLSAPAKQNSGRGSLDAPPKQVDGNGCIHQSCPPNSPPIGTNQSETRLNYVNSFPVTSIKTGIDEIGPKLWNARAELAVTGPNVGDNAGIKVPFSGTVGAAVYAAQNGIPAIAFSGVTGYPTAWNKPTPLHSKIYAELALKVTSTILESGPPYLPPETWLNVNFGKVSEAKCNSADKFTYVLTRIHWGFLSDYDVEWCGTRRLPLESDIRDNNDCYVTISIGDATDKTTIDAARQAQVLPKLQNILSCIQHRPGS